MRIVFSLILSALFLSSVPAFAQTWKLVSPGGGGGRSSGVSCPPPWGGDFLDHGAWVDAYEFPNHPHCESLKGKRGCANGILVGDDKYKFETCGSVLGGAGPYDGGEIWVGMYNGQPLYAASANSGSHAWKTTNTNTPNTSSSTDGHLNTYNMNDVNHPAARVCATMEPVGTWYLPALNEWAVIWGNSTTQGGALNLSAIGLSDTWYATSTGSGVEMKFIYRPYYGTSNGNDLKDQARQVRCVRR